MKETQKAKIERLERENTQLREENTKLRTSLQEAWEKNTALQGAQDDAFLTSPAYRQLTERAKILERENAMLRRRLKQSEKKGSDQAALLEQMRQQVPAHNARGAGRRQKADEERFRSLAQAGKSMQEIMAALQISRPTSFRYKRKYQK